jgi:hypothetical protein
MSLATAIGTHVKRNYIKWRCRSLWPSPMCSANEKTMIVDCFTETERTELSEYIALGTLPRSPFLIACLNGDEALAASIDRERAKATMPLLFCFFPPKAHGAARPFPLRRSS